MTVSALSRDTVMIDESVHSFYKQMTEGNDLIAAPFHTMKDVFIWAASLGHSKGERRALEGKRITIFRWAQFSTQPDLTLLKAIAIADTGGVEVLADTDQILQIAEEYANAGIHELRAQLTQETAQPLWNLVSYIETQG